MGARVTRDSHTIGRVARFQPASKSAASSTGKIFGAMRGPLRPEARKVAKTLVHDRT
jgi:hypothetical protein